MMRAIRFAKTGAIEVLEYSQQLAKPTVADDEVLVRNHYAGINFIDIYHRTGLYKVPLPYTPGREASGIVEAVGSAVAKLRVGDRVCHLSPNCYAEYSAVKEGFCLALPKDQSMEVGAALLLQGLTAMVLCRIVHRVEPGQVVLVYAAAGGTGQLLVQLCRLYGATVIGVTSSEAKAELARKAGAQHIINYSIQDILTEVKRITAGKGVNAVFDSVGKSTFDTSLQCLTRLGSMVSFGNASGKVEPIDIAKLVPNQVRLMRPSLLSLVATPEEFQPLATELVGLLTSGKLVVHVQKIYELKDAGNAQTDLESGKSVGKLLLRIPE